MQFGVGYINSARYNRSDESSRRAFPPIDPLPVETHLAPEYTRRAAEYTGPRLIRLS